jgi:predicted translin family RNA/ssDNA-binding protein
MLRLCTATTLLATADTQKLSKQAIYCLHRGDLDGATAKLQKAQAVAEKLGPIVDAEFALRSCGSYSSSLEEVRPRIHLHS